MKYYTKEWYELMQRQHYTMGMKKLPDNDYTNEEINETFHFHDAEVLRLQKRGHNYEMLLNVRGSGGLVPYMKVTFIETTRVKREQGICLRMKQKDDGEVTSNCWYLYDELYATKDGMEIHMMFTTNSFKYLTVNCRDISFEPMQSHYLL